MNIKLYEQKVIKKLSSLSGKELQSIFEEVIGKDNISDKDNKNLNKTKK
jgi:chromosome segregation ATPase